MVRSDALSSIIALEGKSRLFVNGAGGGGFYEAAERTAAEASLRVSEERFRGIFNQAAVGVGQTSLERIVIDVNPGLCRILGYRREEFLGHHINEFTHPEEQEWAAATMQPLI